MYKGISAACLLSALTAGVISTLASPVTAEKATAITISVNRAAKADRQPIAPPVAQPTRRDSISTGKPSPERALQGCKQAFSTLVEPKRANIVSELRNNRVITDASEIQAGQHIAHVNHYVTDGEIALANL